MKLFSTVYKIKILFYFVSAISITQLATPLLASGRTNGDKFMFLNSDDLHWQKSPMGYSVASGKLWVFQENGDAASIACNFYRNKPGDNPTYSDIGGFRLDVGRWTSVASRPSELRVRLRLIESDKMLKPAPGQREETNTNTVIHMLSANAITKATAIQNARGKKFIRLSKLKNQNELDKMLTTARARLVNF